MKQAKRLLSIAFVLAALLTCLVMSVSATETTVTKVASGSCGSTLTWTLDSTGCLTIEGSGAMPSNYDSESDYSWYSYSSKIKSVVIGQNVTSIGDYAFYRYYSGLKSIAINSKLRSIGSLAFYSSGLTSITLPDTVISIGSSAFSECAALKEVNFGSRLNSIGSSAFSYCNSLTEVTLPARLTFMGTSVFYQCNNLQKVVIPAGITALPDGTFSNCPKLTDVTLPEGMTAIGVSAFYHCYNLPAITLPSTLKTIKDGAFSGCDSLTEVIIPDSVTTLGSSAFAYCDLLEIVTLGDGVTTTGTAFNSCMSLTEVYVGTGLTTLKFSECPSLMDIYFEGNAPTSHSGIPSYTYLHCTPGSTGWTDSEAYDDAAGTWNGYALEIWKQEATGPSGVITDNGGALVLDGIINIKRYFKMSAFDVDTDYILANGGMLVWSEDDMPAEEADAVYGTETAAAELVYEATTDEYSSKYEINSWEYAKNFYFRPYVTIDGQYVYGDIVEYGVINYCEGRFAKSSNAKLRSTLVALLNYGSASQTYFGLNTGVLANAKMDEYIASYSDLASYNDLGWKDSYLTAINAASEEMSVNFAPVGGVTDNGKSLILKGAISVKFYAGVGSNKALFNDSCDAKYYFWTAADYRELEETGRPLTKENASYVVDANFTYSTKYGCEYDGTSKGIYAMYYGDTLYAAFCATDVNGDAYCSGVVTYSPETYAASKLNNGKVDTVDPVAQWMVVYGERAGAYVG